MGKVTITGTHQEVQQAKVGWQHKPFDSEMVPFWNHHCIF
jgi:hypothetical protein